MRERHHNTAQEFAAEYEAIEKKERRLKEEAAERRRRYRKEFREAANLPPHLKKRQEFEETAREITEPKGWRKRTDDNRQHRHRRGYGYRRRRPRGT